MVGTVKHLQCPRPLASVRLPLDLPAGACFRNSLGDTAWELLVRSGGHRVLLGTRSGYVTTGEVGSSPAVGTFTASVAVVVVLMSPTASRRAYLEGLMGG